MNSPDLRSKTGGSDKFKVSPRFGSTRGVAVRVNAKLVVRVGLPSTTQRPRGGAHVYIDVAPTLASDVDGSRS
jgi:hypothetical protein